VIAFIAVFHNRKYNCEHFIESDRTSNLTFAHHVIDEKHLGQTFVNYKLYFLNIS